MTVSVAVWSVAVKPGEPHSIVPQADIRITNVALGDELQDGTGRTSVKLIYNRPGAGEDSDEDEEEAEAPEDSLAMTVLCSLIPGKVGIHSSTQATRANSVSKIEQCTVDVTLESEEEFLLEVVGKNTVYLTGNYIGYGSDQSPEVPFNDDSEPEDEDDFDLRDVSSDVEIDPEELGVPSDEDASRFEEINDEAPKSLKRHRDSDAAMGADEGKPSKAQQKKTNKKLKAETGAAVPSGAEGKSDAKVNGEAKKEKKEKEKKEKKEKGEGAGDKATMRELAGGLKIKDVKVGAGPQAKRGQTVSMRYIGKLQNGKVFDSNTKGKPFTFKLGKGEVIKGWDEGIQGMQAGGERLLVIPPKLGYGSSKSGPIPPNSTLTFECKLVDLK
ncbi:hypothetical protein EVG20_g2012 [Dentipellis fragilis]|uniref:FK506-binding protein n=1 Tax=Dentipellis fragilis TaxID=205917 RepID=A0A4Y9Z8A0_9AGAM|nr:hypothetical protein EVG20_g2012 [Dentipellis fragilis]